MNIDINKKYTTRSGLPVVLFEVSDKVFGKYQRDGIWYANDWPLDGVRYHKENEIDLIPVKTWRAWDVNEGPRFIMVKPKGANAVSMRCISLWEVVENFRKILLMDYVWVHEDGTETPCGVEE